MPEIRLQRQWYVADAHAARPPPALATLPEGVWELPATIGDLRAEISRLQNSVVRATLRLPATTSQFSKQCALVHRSQQAHLERSNAELAAADPEDPDFKEAIAENEVILVAQRYKIQQCERRLQQLGGGSAAHDGCEHLKADASAREGDPRLPHSDSSSTQAISAGGQAPPAVQLASEQEQEPEPEPSADDGLYL